MKTLIDTFFNHFCFWLVASLALREVLKLER
jgi:hypothetical protein